MRLDVVLQNTNRYSNSEIRNLKIENFSSKKVPHNSATLTAVKLHFTPIKRLNVDRFPNH